MIYIKIGIISVTSKRRLITINFNILLLGNDKIILKML